jgi:hypothetical protein
MIILLTLGHIGPSISVVKVHGRRRSLANGPWQDEVKDKYGFVTEPMARLADWLVFSRQKMGCY